MNIRITEEYIVELLKREKLENERTLLIYKITNKLSYTVEFFELYYDKSTWSEGHHLYTHTIGNRDDPSDMPDIVDEYITEDL